MRLSRCVTILFPELEKLVSSLYLVSTLEMLHSFPGANRIAACRVDKLSTLLSKVSRGQVKREKAEAIKAAAKDSIGRSSQALSFELTQTIDQLWFYEHQITAVEKQIADIVKNTASPLLTIPGIGITLAAIIMAEIGDIKRFSSADKLQAFAGLDPAMYQSGKFKGNKVSMVKHGSTYLRWAIMQASRIAARLCPMFRDCLARKREQEQKHYFVALSHVAKKLLRVIFHLLNMNEAFVMEGDEEVKAA